MNSTLHIGTCSWKYASWRRLVYSDTPGINYLAEYARKYDSVEIDQWFWSLFRPDKVVLPQASIVAEYAASVPKSFRFGIKIPNALTLTHFYPDTKTASPAPNPHFLSPDVFQAFMARIQPLKPNLGPLMFQFGYLNKQKMASQDDFLNKLDPFVAQLPSSYTWCIEIRNPNYLNDRYFAFLRKYHLAHVWQQGYYMPSIFGIYEKYADQLTDTVVIRLHGPEREGMEERAGKDWSKIIESRDTDLDALAGLLKDIKVGRRTGWLFVNNHFEGSAPLTIERIKVRMGT